MYPSPCNLLIAWAGVVLRNVSCTLLPFLIWPLSLFFGKNFIDNHIMWVCINKRQALLGKSRKRDCRINAARQKTVIISLTHSKAMSGAVKRRAGADDKVNFLRRNTFSAPANGNEDSI